jgi:hypothetical protein
MLKKAFALMLPTVFAVAALSASASTGVATEAFDCGSTNVTAWLLPQGTPKGFAPGYEKDTIPAVEIFNGWGRPSIPTMAAYAHAGIAGVGFGRQCAPKGYLPSRLKRAALVRVKTPAKLRCSFPSRPLLRIVTLANGDKRLDVVISSKTLVASASLTTLTSTIDYAKTYCTMTPVSLHA